MSDLILYLGITIVGYVLGTVIRDKKESFSWTGKVQLVALIALVLLMGMRMGANEEVTSNISTIGLTALMMTVVILIFTVMAVFFTRKLVGMDKYGKMKSGNVTGVEGAQTAGEPEEANGGSGSMTLAIVIAVAIGMAIGYLIVPRIYGANTGDFDDLASMGIRIGLCMLLLFVGLDLGIEGTIASQFRQVGLRIFAFPLMAIVGTLFGALVCSFFVDFSLRECLAIGAGFGWYTLAPGIIMDSGYVTASAVSFMHNVLRELFSIVLIPVVAKKIGYVETTALPGAAAMDVCLPVVERATRSDIAVYSFISGAVLSIVVPILVPLLVG